MITGGRSPAADIGAGPAGQRDGAAVFRPSLRGILGGGPGTRAGTTRKTAPRAPNGSRGGAGGTLARPVSVGATRWSPRRCTCWRCTIRTPAPRCRACNGHRGRSPGHGCALHTVVGYTAVRAPAPRCHECPPLLGREVVLDTCHRRRRRRTARSRRLRPTATLRPYEAAPHGTRMWRQPAAARPSQHRARQTRSLALGRASAGWDPRVTGTPAVAGGARAAPVRPRRRVTAPAPRTSASRAARA